MHGMDREGTRAKAAEKLTQIGLVALNSQS